MLLKERKKQLLEILLGDYPTVTVKSIVHLLFWAVSFKWLLMQALFMTLENQLFMAYLIASQKAFFVIIIFYIISYLLKLNRSGFLVAFYVFTVLLIFLFLYNISTYYLYNYINEIRDMPDFYKRFVVNLSKSGALTFLKNEYLLYYNSSELGISLFPSLIVKAFHIAFQSNLRKLKVEKENLALEIGFLRSQINPHFLFNTLNSIYALIEDKDETAATIIFSLSNMMRYALYNSSMEETEVSRELDFINNYIEIQRIRHGKRLAVDMDFIGNMKTVKIPPLILINFVENAFKHAVDITRQPSWIKITASAEVVNEFSFGISNSVDVHHTAKNLIGIGVSNTKRRLDILYADRHSLEITENDESYNVLLKTW